MPDPITVRVLPPLPDPAGVPCPHCLAAERVGDIRWEAVQPLPDRPPLLRRDNTPCCHDCESADTLVALKLAPDWGMARTAVQNDRREQYRQPGTPMGLVFHCLMRPSGPDALTKQWAWLDGLSQTGEEG